MVQYFQQANTGGITMSEHQLPAYYTALFAAVEDAINAIDELNFGEAKKRLIEGQQKAEELYLEEN